MNLDDVLNFVKLHKLAVVTTIDKKHKPQAAVVEFGEMDDLTIIFDTFKSSRKYQNIKQNNAVAAVIGWDDNKTVQIDAVAKELSGEELEQAKNAYFTKIPDAKKWSDNPEIAYFALHPNWIRYSDLNQNPWFIKEFNL